jgi:uncharacterized membrane protein YccC
MGKMKWFLDRAAFLLACCVLAGLVSGWFLPTTYQVAMTLAYAQIIMALVVVVREGYRIYGSRVPASDT